MARLTLTRATDSASKTSRANFFTSQTRAHVLTSSVMRDALLGEVDAHA